MNDIKKTDKFIKLIYNKKVHLLSGFDVNNTLLNIINNNTNNITWEKYIFLLNNILINENIFTTSSIKSIIISNNLQANTILELQIIKKQYGGIIKAFMSIIQIGKVFLLLLDFVKWFIKFVAWVVMFIIWLFKFLIYDMITDFYKSITILTITIIKLPIDVAVSICSYIANAIGGFLSSTMGWDQTNLNINDKNSIYFKSIDRTKGKKCYLTSNNKVPFSVLLGTIFCPPLGVFMDRGITGWFNILICLLLTLLYYIPGLFYALIILYS